MKYNILITGFGGQGVMLLGQMLSYAAIHAGMNATFYPSYGPEQRGGTANCSVVIAEHEIGSPIVTKPNVLVCFNAAALEKFLPRLQAGGILFANTSLIDDASITRADVEIVKLPLTEMANEIGSQKVANIIMFGAVVAKTGALPMEALEATLVKQLGHKPELLELNKQALLVGSKAAVR